MAVVHESSFIKAFDDFFQKKLAPEYQKQTGIQINYELTSVGSMQTRITTVTETKSGPEIEHGLDSTGRGSTTRTSST